jgi:two-component system LytT family response regulator
MKPLSALIVDDERPARERLQDLLAREPDVELAASCLGGEEAVRAIRSEAPDLAFLDVQMPEVSGLEVIRRIGPDAVPVVIFVTAYDRYALDAFEMAALDYLLKPYADQRFEEGLERARRQARLQEQATLSRKMSRLLEETREEEGAPNERGFRREERDRYLDRIAVERRDQRRVVPVGEIRYIAAEGPYVKLYVEEGAHLIRERMKTLEERLDPRRFCRIHRSTMVNLARVEAIKPHATGGQCVQLHEGTRLKISRSRNDEVEKRLGVLR